MIAALAALATQAISQTDPAQIQARAEEALVGGDPAQTVLLANQLLALNPDSFAALYLLALAQADLGNHGQSASSAGRAYRAATTESTKLQAARLAGTAHFRAKHFARSELWFRRAANHIQTEEEAEAVVRAFQRAQTANPLSTQYTASIAPSDNINGGSDSDSLCFENLDGTCAIELGLREDQLSLSGLEYSGSARITYRLSQDRSQTTNIGALLYGQGVIFSDDTRDSLAASDIEVVNSLKQSDFSAVLAEFSLEQRQTNLSPLGPTRVALNTGYYWRADELLVSYGDLILAQQIILSPNTALLFEGSMRQQNAIAPGLLDVDIYDLSGAYSISLPNNDMVRFTLSGRYNDADEESTFEEYRLRLDYTYATAFAGTRWSTFTEIGYRSFEEFSITFDGRRDHLLSAGITGVFEDIAYFGFSPSVSLFASQTESDVSVADSSEISLRFGVASNF